MIRTQISISEKEYEAAKAEAARQGISLAELLRRSVRHLLRADEIKPWMRYAGMVKTSTPLMSNAS
jgi:Ribbon-helix-helix protein, copG family